MPGGESNTAGVDYYKLLDVPYTATFQEITRAYRQAMKRAHPDRHRPDKRAAAEERSKQINAAYQILSQADSRRAYDETLKTSAVQDQNMSRYAGGFGPPGSATDPYAQGLRRHATAAERAERRQSDRSALLSIFLVFAAVTLFVILTLVLIEIGSAIISALL